MNPKAKPVKNLMKTPTKNPKNAPIAAFKAPFLLSLLIINSPKKAPKKDKINYFSNRLIRKS